MRKYAAAAVEHFAQGGNEILRGEQIERVDSQLVEYTLPLHAVRLHGLGVLLAQLLVAQVAFEEFACFGVAEADAACGRQLDFGGVIYTHGNELVAEIQLADGLFIDLGQEITDEEYQRAIDAWVKIKNSDIWEESDDDGDDL